MNSRRLVCFLLGLWMGGSLLMACIATENLSSVDRLLGRPHPVVTAEFKELGRANARLLLAYQVSEQNRWYLASWETAQIVMGTLFFSFMLFATGENKVSLLLVLLMLAGALLQRF